MEERTLKKLSSLYKSRWIYFFNININLFLFFLFYLFFFNYVFPYSFNNRYNTIIRIMYNYISIYLDNKKKTNNI
jgi:hypothetical protein